MNERAWLVLLLVAGSLFFTRRLIACVRTRSSVVSRVASSSLSFLPFLICFCSLFLCFCAFCFVVLFCCLLFLFFVPAVVLPLLCTPMSRPSDNDDETRQVKRLVFRSAVSLLWLSALRSPLFARRSSLDWTPAIPVYLSTHCYPHGGMCVRMI